MLLITEAVFDGAAKRAYKISLIGTWPTDERKHG